MPCSVPAIEGFASHAGRQNARNEHNRVVIYREVCEVYREVPFAAITKLSRACHSGFSADGSASRYIVACNALSSRRNNI